MQKIYALNEQLRNRSDKFEFTKWMGAKLWQRNLKLVVCTNYSWIEAKNSTFMIAIYSCELWWSHSEIIKSWFSCNFLTLFANVRFYVLNCPFFILCFKLCHVYLENLSWFHCSWLLTRMWCNFTFILLIFSVTPSRDCVARS